MSGDEQRSKIHISLNYDAVIPEYMVSESVMFGFKVNWFPVTNTLVTLLIDSIHGWFGNVSSYVTRVTARLSF